MPADQLFAPYMTDNRLLRILILESRMHDTKPTRMSAVYPIVLKALETATNAHKRGGCTSGQLQEMEAGIARLEEMSA